MRKKVIRYSLVFFVFMLICTVVSQGIYAWQMPQVKVGEAETKAIDHKIEKVGKLVPVSEKALVLEEGLWVREVCVEVGATVEQGTVLFRIDEDRLKEKVKQLSRELVAERQKLGDLQAAGKAQAQMMNTASKRGRRDIQDTVTEQKKKVKKAKEQYRAAQKKLLSYVDFNTYLNEEKDRSAEYQTLRAAAGKEGAAKEDKDAFEIFSSTFEAQVKKDWQEGIESLEKEVSEKKTAAQDAGEEKEKAVKEAKKQASRAIQDVKNSQMKNDGGICEQENIIKEKQEQLAKYEKYAGLDGEVRSKEKGTIQKINVKTGEETVEGAAVILADGKKGWYFQADLSEEERGYIDVGETATLEFQAAKVKIPDVIIQGIQRKGDGNYQLIAFVKNSKLRFGESGTLSVTSDSGIKDCCVPLSALYAGGSENYVLVLNEKESFLGKEYSVVKRKVIVKEKNEEYAALEDGSIGGDESFVTLCDREVKPGDKVRMLEGDD